MKSDHVTHNVFSRRIPAILLAGMLLCITINTSSCTSAAAKEAPMDAAAVTFDPTVYYARDGRIRFLYDDACDMISAVEGYDMVSVYSGQAYSMVFSYRRGTLDRKSADAAVKAEFDTGDGIISLSSGTKSVDVSGHPFRRAEISCADGSHGAVLYGSTASGFAELYYILAPDADEGTEAHVEEILSTVQLAEFSGEDEEDVKIYIE